MKILDLFKKEQIVRPITMPYIIAEVGVNHEGSIDLAKRLIDEAKEGGADAVKFQTYKAEKLAAKNSPAYWDITKEPTTSQFELFKKHDSFWKEEMFLLKDYCSSMDIEFMSTPFDIESATFLNEVMDVFKISSSDITNKPFIEYISQFKKPIILSTGASNLDEINNAVEWIYESNDNLALLHCILNYPTLDENANIGMIWDISNRFQELIIGYSDHTLPNNMKVCEIATLMGARIIEKHFTHDKTLPGNDHYHAMDINDLKHFKSLMKKNIEILGEFQKKSLDSEIKSRENARRSLVANRFIAAGEIIKAEDLTFKRPASGISPEYIQSVINRTAKIDIHEDDILTHEMIR